jgi:hypothetical protein
MRTRLVTISLARALRYRNRDVVEKFADRFQVPDREAQAIFDDTKRWLWLCSLPGRPKLLITPPLLVIDEMWHTFVLFSAAYADYCESTFGRLLHHVPTSRRDRLRAARLLERDPERVARQRRKQAERQYRFIADKLGDEALVRWYAEYPLRYDAAFFRRFGIEGHDLPPKATEILASLSPVTPAVRARGSASPSASRRRYASSSAS